MASISVPIQVNLPDDWVDQVVNRLRNDPDAEWATVVRCKDCKNYIADGVMVCDRFMDASLKPNDFCSYGEEKSDDRPDKEAVTAREIDNRQDID